MKNLLIQTIKSAITKTPFSYAEEIDYDVLFNLSKAHDLIPLVSEGLFKSGLLPDTDTGNNFKLVQKTALFMFAKRETERNKLIATFSENEVPFILLKGSVLRDFYPEQYLRTQGDIDVLVPPDKYDFACELMINELGCVKSSKSSHDITFTTPVGVQFELHFSLDGTTEAEEELLKTVWNYTYPHKENPYMLYMNNEFFMFYHIVHMAKHFKAGGIGIKAFLDFHIIKENMKYNEENLRNLLNASSLLTFYNSINELSSMWFENASSTPLSLELEQFVLKAGVFGSIENNVALEQLKKGGKIKHLLDKAFLSREKMGRYYQNSKKYPILLPYYQIKRWCRILFSNGRAHALAEIKENQLMTSEKQQKIDNLYKQLNLK